MVLPSGDSFAGTGRAVYINVYDLDERVAGLNSVLANVGIGGAYHAGVEVHGEEYVYSQWSQGKNAPGIQKHLPRCHDVHRFRTSVFLGWTPHSRPEVLKIIEQLGKVWTCGSYDLLTRNCCHFCDAYCVALGVGHIPNWIMALPQLVADLHQKCNWAADMLKGVGMASTTPLSSLPTSSMPTSTRGLRPESSSGASTTVRRDPLSPRFADNRAAPPRNGKDRISPPKKVPQSPPARPLLEDSQPAVPSAVIAPSAPSVAQPPVAPPRAQTFAGFHHAQSFTVEEEWVIAVDVPGTQRILLPRGSHLVGSSLAARVFVPHPHVACQHATLHVTADEVWVEAHDPRTQVGLSPSGPTWPVAPGNPSRASEVLFLGPALVRLSRRESAATSAWPQQPQQRAHSPSRRAVSPMPRQPNRYAVPLGPAGGAQPVPQRPPVYPSTPSSPPPAYPQLGSRERGSFAEPRNPSPLGRAQTFAEPRDPSPLGRAQTFADPRNPSPLGRAQTFVEPRHQSFRTRSPQPGSTIPEKPPRSTHSQSMALRSGSSERLLH